MKTYKVNEIFYSLQGEGCHTGTPAVFVRLSGCNRACPFCDTDHAAGRAMTAAEIAAEVAQYPARHIVITGGEPALQIDEALVAVLKSKGHYLQIETNGSLPLPDGIDWVTCSPKDEPWRIGHVDELKIVYQGQDVEAIASRFDARALCLQPCSGANIPETVAYIMAHPHWRLSLQTHK
ncbi:MAG: 7-carboxy-7-deazaguanine synthase QueE, partial [Muribaculaceae bacterium]|nr:7-carboxy-7-deazaguanine synthase QueE [Muribaculaceae bacterium]